MNRRTFMSSTAAVPLSAALNGWTPKDNAGDRPPNILLILFDKCRTDAIGAYGERPVHTPHIDNLAGTGVMFQHCYTPQALCGPARASIITGHYPHAHGLRRNPYPDPPDPNNCNYQESIPDPFRDSRFRLWPNFPYLLNSAGYATGLIGKWHLGPANPGFFDYWKGFNSGLPHWIGAPHQSAYRPDVHTDQGIRFIAQHTDEPFFLYQSYYPPHEPYDPPKEDLADYEGQEHAGYYGSVTNLDRNVGRLIDALRTYNILDDTLIILTTEHGRTWIERPGTTAGMAIAYDDASRIPLIMRYPRALPQGTVWHSGVSLVDLMPTILEAAGMLPRGGVMGHGRSLLSEIHQNRDQWTRPMMIQNIPQAAIQNSLYEERAVREKQFKLILRKFDNRPFFRPGELYDMHNDPGEQNNLYEAPGYTTTVNAMAALMQAWGQEHADRLAVELGSWAESASMDSPTRPGSRPTGRQP